MEIITGIASNTYVDRHNEQMTKSALDDMAEQINARYYPLNIEHDIDATAGVVLYGEVFKLHDGEYALGAVFGVFENEEERKTFEYGQPNTTWGEYKSHLPVEKMTMDHEKMYAQNPALRVTDDKQEWSPEQLLEMFLDSSKIWTDGSVYRIKHFIASTGDLRIDVYAKDHWPPHFHVSSKQRGIDARFDLHTLEYLSTKTGNIRPDDIKKIHAFLKQYPEVLTKLRDNYKRLNPED